MYTIVSDFHTHSSASQHAFSTIGEMLVAAAERGLYALALTEHAPDITDGTHPWRFGSMDSIPPVVNNVKFFSGVEVNIGDYKGMVDLPVVMMKNLDFVIASLHDCVIIPASEEEHTAALLAAARNPDIDCLGHIERGNFPFDIKRVVDTCIETGTLIEVNNASFKRNDKNSLERAIKTFTYAKSVSLPVIVNSDAHSSWEVGVFTEALRVLEEVNYPEELIVNSSIQRLDNYLSRR